MYIYAVSVNIDPEVESRWLTYMKEEHIPDVLATGCFLSYKMYRVTTTSQGEVGSTYSIQYFFEDMALYQQYQKEFAPRLQQEHTQAYLNKFVAFRTILEEV